LSKFEVFDISTAAGYLTFVVCSSFKPAHWPRTELTLCKPLMYSFSNSDGYSHHT
jgi:hypothetical protein